MGTSSGEEVDGWDVLLTRLGDGEYFVDARTEKGEALVSSLAGGRPAAEADLAARQEAWRRNFKMLRKHELRMNPTDLPMLLEQSYDHVVWEEKAELCHSCGSCNLVCPTCYCFDVQDELDWNLETGTRSRSWDGCMLREFAMVAGNHNFREQKAARYRHRYLRKGKYTHDMIGKISCVGCGRCVTACTTKIANPVEVYNRLLETAS
jgi:ferredoxin